MALALAACSKTPVDPGTAVSGDVEEVITARMVGTRVDFDGVQGLFTWSEGDQIAVHCSAGYNASGAEVIAPKYKTPSITIDANDPAYCTFHLIQSAGQKRDAYAVYPASIVDLTSDGTSLNITLPASYEIGPEGMGTTSPTPMVAVNDPTATELYFKHVGGLLRLTLNDVSPATKVITVNLGKRLTGEFAVNDPGSAVPYIATDDAADEVSFVLSEELADYTDGLVLNVPVPTGTYSMLKVSAKNSNGETVYAYEDKTERFFDAGRGRRVETSISSLAIPLCLEAIEVGTVVVTNPLGLTIEYSRDNETWTSTSSDLYLVVNEGDCVYLRGNNAKYSMMSFESDDWDNCTTIATDGQCYIYGNIMSLIDAENFVDCKTLTEDFAFSSLFTSASDLVNHPEKSLELPATTLTNACYAMMFYGCSGLSVAPVLPAKNVPIYAYYAMFFSCRNIKTAAELNVDSIDMGGCIGMYYMCTGLTSSPDIHAPVIGEGALAQMFAGCSSLTNAPALDIDELADECFASMFAECTSLVSAPELRWTTMKESCFEDMFSGCLSLTTPPALPATELADECYNNMFSHCSSLTSAPVLPATTMADQCYDSMFEGCTSLTAAPALPSTELAYYCYESMFADCTSLTAAPELPATVAKERCYASMFSGCTSLMSAPDIPLLEVANYCCHRMFSGCTSLVNVPATLPAETMAESCYQYMFQNCSSIQTAPALPSLSLRRECYWGMFEGCTSLTAAPDLLATDTTNATQCYEHMFFGCSNLSYVKALLVDKDYFTCLDWLDGVSATGTFVKNAAALWDETGPSGIPAGWTVEKVTL